MFLKTMLACGICSSTELGTGPLRPDATPEEAPEVLVSHEGAAHFTCPRGHSNVHVFQGWAYGLLYERALQRLAEGATRDAVLDAFTALEMYLATVPERVRFEAHPGARLEEVRRQLQPAVKTSERATAAALIAISIRSGKEPPAIPNWLNETRNEATHAGKYPDPDRAEKVVLEIARVVKEFESLFKGAPVSVDATYAHAAFGFTHTQQQQKHPDAKRWTVYLPLVLDALYEGKTIDAKEQLEEYRRGAVFFRLR